MNAFESSTDLAAGGSLGRELWNPAAQTPMFLGKMWAQLGRNADLSDLQFRDWVEALPLHLPGIAGFLVASHGLRVCSARLLRCRLFYLAVIVALTAVRCRWGASATALVRLVWCVKE